VMVMEEKLEIDKLQAVFRELLAPAIKNLTDQAVSDSEARLPMMTIHTLSWIPRSRSQLPGASRCA
jgi:hypothetical protein